MMTDWDERWTPSIPTWMHSGRRSSRQALVKAQIDLSVIFYDVTAFIAHGRYADSEFIDFGFAHNTPSNKRKFKLGLNASADGNIPWLYRRLSGSTADQATVEENLENLAAWLHSHGYACQDSLIVGDRAMLNAEIARGSTRPRSASSDRSEGFDARSRRRCSPAGPMSRWKPFPLWMVLRLNTGDEAARSPSPMRANP